MPSILLCQLPSSRLCMGGIRRASTSAKEAALKILETTESKTITKKQFLDANQIQRLSLTLLRPELYPEQSIEKSAPKNGTPIPPGYHLVYFTPSALENKLGEDGTDRAFNPVRPFTRRMWAGGSMNWAKGKSMKVGEEVEERTKIVSAVPKKSRDGGEIILIGVEKEFWGGDGRVVVDQRSWIFLPELSSPAIREKPLSPYMNSEYIFSKSSVHDHPSEKNTLQRTFSWSPIALFRFSALTFNAHMIHYSDPWCRTVESHRKPVVHGPLNLINIMDLWRDNYGNAEGDAPEKITYRALAPLYAGEPYTMFMKNEGGKITVGVTEGKEKINMSAEIRM